MNWFVTASSGQSSSGIIRKIKKVIRTDPFFIRLFKKYDIPVDKVDDLAFKIKDLRGMYAKSNSKEIHLDSKLFEDDDFIKNNMHFVVHELVHWLTRQREKDCYFADPEEIEAFTHAIAYEILRGEHDERLRKTFFPIIEAHFDEATNANLLFKALLAKAHLKADSWRSHYN